MIRVLAVENDPVAAAAHRAYVERAPGFEVVAVVGDGRSALRALQQNRPHPVLLDFHRRTCTGSPSAARCAPQVSVPTSSR